MLDVSIIVVNWNAKDLVRKCVEHVISTTKQTTYEIVVVDNASSDGSVDMLRQDFPNVRLIANTDNVGFAGANNQGIASSGGRYVLLLNSDAFVKEYTIDRMVQFMDEHPDAGMSACKLLYEDGTVQPSCTSFPTLITEFYTATGLEKAFPNSPIFGGYLMRYWDHNDLREVDVILGAFMLVRREVIEQVGMMDASFFMYSEEVDWCYRCKAAGWKIYSTPVTDAIHIWGGTSNQVKTEMQIQLYRSRIQFFRKHYGLLQAQILKLMIGAGCLMRVGPGALYYLTVAGKYGREQFRFYRRLLVALSSF